MAPTKIVVVDDDSNIRDVLTVGSLIALDDTTILTGCLTIGGPRYLLTLVGERVKAILEFRFPLRDGP